MHRGVHTFAWSIIVIHLNNGAHFRTFRHICMVYIFPCSISFTLQLLDLGSICCWAWLSLHVSRFKGPEFWDLGSIRSGVLEISGLEVPSFEIWGRSGREFWNLPSPSVLNFGKWGPWVPSFEILGPIGPEFWDLGSGVLKFTVP